MAAKRVESYLDYHKIGPLFEDLMAKLIKDMPEQPIPFLIKLLKKHSPEDNIPHSRPPSGSKSRSPMSSSMSLSGKPVPRQSLDDSREFKRSALAKSWAAPDTRDRPTSASKSREYDRPWLHGSKKGRGEQSHSNKENSKHGMKRAEERPSSWNPDTKVSYNDFDEWFEAQNKKQKGAGQTGPTVQDTESKQSWHDNHDELDTSMDKRGIGYPLHVNIKSRQTPPQADADDLEEEEISFSRHRKTRGESSEGNSVASDSSSGRYSKKNARHASKEHRKQLESLLFKSSDASCQSQHHGKLSDEDKDDGTELLESPNELENEGVANPVNSGYKVSKGLKSGASSQESVKVSICARCARIISGMPSDQRSDAASNFSNGTDDDFESVSQAGSMTGEPARIKWPSGFDSENDTATPRKNKPMWEKPDTKPQKGKHMYNRNSSTFLTDLVGSPSPRPTSAASGRSDDLFIPKPGKGWQPKSGEYSSDNDTDVNVKYGRSSPSTTRLAEGRPWARPLDSASDAGSEDWTLDRSKKVNFKPKGFRRSYLTDDSDH